jgi:hypothetical protein
VNVIPPPSFDLCVCGLPNRWHLDDTHRGLTCLELRQYAAEQLIQTPPALADVLQRSLQAQRASAQQPHGALHPERQTLNLHGAAARLGLSVRTVSRRLRAGTFPIPLVEGLVDHRKGRRFYVRDIDTFLANHGTIAIRKRPAIVRAFQSHHVRDGTALRAVGGSRNT